MAFAFDVPGGLVVAGRNGVALALDCKTSCHLFLGVGPAVGWMIISSHIPTGWNVRTDPSATAIHAKPAKRVLG